MEFFQQALSRKRLLQNHALLQFAPRNPPPASSLVSPECTPAPLAQEPQSVSHLDQRGNAPANSGNDGYPVFPPLSGDLPNAEQVGAGRRAGCLAPLGRPRVLSPRSRSLPGGETLAGKQTPNRPQRSSVRELAPRLRALHDQRRVVAGI